MFSVNYLAVVGSLIAYTILGMLWYGPLFGKPWMKLVGKDTMDMNSPENKKSAMIGYISSLVSGFVALLTLAVVLNAMSISGAVNGMLGGAGLAFGFIAMTLVGEAAWHDTPWGLVALNSGYRICGLAVGGLIIGAW